MARDSRQVLAPTEVIIIGTPPKKVQEKQNLLSNVETTIRAINNNIVQYHDYTEEANKANKQAEILVKLLDNPSVTEEEKKIISPVLVQYKQSKSNAEMNIASYTATALGYKERLTKEHNTFIDKFLELQAEIKKTPPKQKTVAEITAELTAWGHSRARCKPSVYTTGGQTFIAVGIPAGTLMRPDKNEYPWLNGGGPVAVKLGAIDITFNIRDGALKITGARKDGFNIVGYSSAAYPHPHVLSHGVPCLGDFAAPFREAVDKGEFAMALDVVLMFLSHANVADPAGNKWIRWAMGRLFPGTTPSTPPKGETRYRGNTYTLAPDGETVTEHPPEPMERYTPEELEAILSGQLLPSPKKIGLLWHPSMNIPPRPGMFIKGTSSAGSALRWIVQVDPKTKAIKTGDNGASPWASRNGRTSLTTRTDIIKNPSNFLADETGREHQEIYESLMVSILLNSVLSRECFHSWIPNPELTDMAVPECFTRWDGKPETLKPGVLVFDERRSSTRLVVAVGLEDVIFLSDDRTPQDVDSPGQFIRRHSSELSNVPAGRDIPPTLEEKLKQMVYHPLQNPRYAELGEKLRKLGYPEVLFNNGWVPITSGTVPAAPAYDVLLKTGKIQTNLSLTEVMSIKDMRFVRLPVLVAVTPVPPVAPVSAVTATELFIEDARSANPGQTIIITQEMARELKVIPPDVEVM